MSSSRVLSSPPHGHQHVHPDVDECCASTAAAPLTSSPLTDVPLEELSIPGPSSFHSYINSHDLPPPPLKSLHHQRSQESLDAQNYPGLADLGKPVELTRSFVDVDGPSRDPLGLSSLALSDSHGDSALSAYDVPSMHQRKKVEPAFPTAQLNPRLAFNMDNFSNCLSGMGPPAPPGGYLEPSSHFFTNQEPIVTMQLLWAVMKEAKVDCEVMVGLFRVKCEAYRESARCEFHIRLFSVGDERGTYAVEFQRRFGDGMVFHNLYAETKKAFDAAARKAAGETGAPSSPSPVQVAPLQCPPLDMPEMRCCRQVKCDVMKVLIGMAASDCVDVKANAITALAEMSAREEMKEPMLESGVADIFIDGLGCSNQDVHRCSLTGLANLIGCGRNTRTCQLWMKTEKTKHALCRLTKSACPQIVRECARSFEYIAETLKEQVKEDQCFKHCLARLLCSQDAETRESALRAQQLVDAV